MNPLRIELRASAALCLFLFAVSPLAAQATRTWVSGVGDDVNPGSRTAPCKTFAGAISKTATGGEINCLDAGGFGALTITKSITIDGAGTHASILNALTTGVIVNGPDIVVTIRNLSIQGARNGVTGIKLVKGAVLNVEHCVIANQTGSGIEIVPGSNALVFIKDTIIRGNMKEKEGCGIRIAPDETFRVEAFLDNVRLEDNFSGLMVEDRVSVIRLNNVTVTGNAIGVSAVGRGRIISFGNNRIDGNAMDGKPTETKPLK